MKILEMVENEDGSATCQVEMTLEEKEMLLQFAFVELLKKHIQENKSCADLDDLDNVADGTTRSHAIEDE